MAEVTITEFFPWAVDVDDKGYHRSDLPFEEAIRQSGAARTALPLLEMGFMVDLSAVGVNDALLLVRRDPRTGHVSREEVEVLEVGTQGLRGRARVSVGR